MCAGSTGGAAAPPVLLQMSSKGEISYSKCHSDEVCTLEARKSFL